MRKILRSKKQGVSQRRQLPLRSALARCTHHSSLLLSSLPVPSSPEICTHLDLAEARCVTDHSPSFLNSTITTGVCLARKFSQLLHACGMKPPRTFLRAMLVTRFWSPGHGVVRLFILSRNARRVGAISIWRTKPTVCTHPRFLFCVAILLSPESRCRRRLLGAAVVLRVRGQVGRFHEEV